MDNILYYEIEPIYSEENDMTFIMRSGFIGGYRKSRELLGWYHGEPNDSMNTEYIGKFKAEYADITESMELYIAIVNIMDDIAIHKKEYDHEISKVVETLARKGGVDIESFCDANDCDTDCKTWKEVSDEFKRLWKEGQRV